MSKLKNTKVLAVTAMLSAIAIILGFFKIPLTQMIEIRFQNLPIAIGGFMFGPAIGAIIGGISDVGGYLAKPTGPFFPGFTISAIVSGLIYGYILHKKDAGLKEILIAQIIITVIVNLGLNSLWLSMLYGKAFIAILTGRIIKEAIMYPINSAILLVVINVVKRSAKGLLGD